MISRYKLVAARGGASEKLFQAVHDGHIPSIPVNLTEGDGYMLYCLFSPNFSFYIDIDAAKEMFVVKETLTGDTKWFIPKSLLRMPKD
jgi:hypothetical protein